MIVSQTFLNRKYFLIKKETIRVSMFKSNNIAIREYIIKIILN